MIEEVFETKANFNRQRRHQKTVYNGRSAFMRARGLNAVTVKPVWNALSEAERAWWSDEGKRLTIDASGLYAFGINFFLHPHRGVSLTADNVDPVRHTIFCTNASFLIEYQNQHIKEKKEYDELIDRYCDQKPAPLRSRDRKCPVDVDELFSLLNGEQSELASRWTERNISDWVKTLGDECEPHTLDI